MNMRKILISFVLCAMLFSCKAVTWTTVSSGFWNSGSIWAGGTIPPYSSSDTFNIKHPVVIENDLLFNSGSFVKIDSAGGICGHHNISVFTNAKLIKYGILELDTLRIPGGQVACNATGSVILTEAGIITNGGTLSINGCSFAVGPWFNCLQPAYDFAAGIADPMNIDPIRLFPNPGNGQLQAVFSRKSQLIIADLLGRTLYSQTFTASTENTMIDLSFLENGIYSWITFSDNLLTSRDKIEIIK